MAIRSSETQVIRRFTCLSTDTKPTSASNPKPSHNDELFETDTGFWYVYDETGWSLFPVHVPSLSGERLRTSSTGADHMAVSGEWAISDAIDLSGNDSTTIYNGPCVLGGVWVETTIGTAAVTLDDNVTARATLPVALPIGMHAFEVIFGTSLIVNPADTSTGIIRVKWRPLDPAVTWHEAYY